MRQQINLYQSKARHREHMLAARPALRLLAVLTVGMVLTWQYDAWQVRRLDRHVAELQQTQADQVTMLTRYGASMAARPSTASLEPQWREVRAELAAHQRALTRVSSGGMGNTAGFAPALRALARHHVEGLWLDRLSLSAANGLQSLDGVAIDAELIPRYLRDLGQEHALAGAHFDDVRIGHVDTSETAGDQATAATGSDPASATAKQPLDVNLHFHAGLKNPTADAKEHS